MKNEQADKVISEKMANMSMPGNISFDKQEAWQKLEQLLHPKPKAIISWYYIRWAAAAALLIGIGILALNKPAQKHIVNTKPVQEKPPLVTPKPEHQTSTSVAAIQRQTKPVIHMEPNKQKPLIQGTVMKLVQTPNTEPPKHPLDTISINKGRSTKDIVVKKLKTVHINDVFYDESPLDSKSSQESFITTISPGFNKHRLSMPDAGTNRSTYSFKGIFNAENNKQ